MGGFCRRAHRDNKRMCDLARCDRVWLHRRSNIPAGFDQPAHTDRAGRAFHRSPHRMHTRSRRSYHARHSYRCRSHRRSCRGTSYTRSRPSSHAARRWRRPRRESRWPGESPVRRPRWPVRPVSYTYPLHNEGVRQSAATYYSSIERAFLPGSPSTRTWRWTFLDVARTVAVQHAEIQYHMLSVAHSCHPLDASAAPLSLRPVYGPRRTRIPLKPLRSHYSPRGRCCRTHTVYSTPSHRTARSPSPHPPGTPACHHTRVMTWGSRDHTCARRRSAP
jgi:hypothetical protein